MLASLLVAAVLGVMLFFSVAVAPGIFKVLPAEWAGRYVRAFFPKYYLVLGLVSTAAAALAEPPRVALILGICAGLFALSLWVLTPATNRATDAGRRRAFAWLHGSTIAINLVQIGLFIWTLVLMSAKPAAG